MTTNINSPINLIVVYGPGNLLAGLSATEQSRRLGKSSSNLVLFFNPGLESNVYRLASETIERLLRGSDTSYLEIGPGDFNSLNLDELVSTLNSTGEQSPIFNMYYPHDCLGDFVLRLVTTFRPQKIVCFGDALGLAVRREDILELLETQRKTNPLRFLKALGRTLLVKRKKPGKAIDPDFFNLILPADQFGGFINSNKLSVVPKALVLEEITELSSNIRDLFTTFESIAPSITGVLLTENFSEANFMPFEREIEMYADSITNHFARGSTIFIKPHPLQIFERGSHLQTRLGQDFNLLFCDSTLAYVPIELWPPSILEKTIISMQYPRISLKYLFGVEVQSLIENDRIPTWFNSDVIPTIVSGEHYLQKSIELLDNWDSASILYSPNIEKVSKS